jgi:methylglyoxal synthase
MKKLKRIGLVAHDARKKDMVEWINDSREYLRPHKLWATGTTGQNIMAQTDLSVIALKSGPLGGDAQLGAMICEGELDALFFFSDPLAAMPHDVDVKALIRLSTLYNIIMACNRTSADFIIRSPMFFEDYEPQQYDPTGYLKRTIGN